MGISNMSIIFVAKAISICSRLINVNILI